MVIEVKYLHLGDGKVTLSRSFIKRHVIIVLTFILFLKVYLSSLQVQVR